MSGATGVCSRREQGKSREKSSPIKQGEKNIQTYIAWSHGIPVGMQTDRVKWDKDIIICLTVTIIIIDSGFGRDNNVILYNNILILCVTIC